MIYLDNSATTQVRDEVAKFEYDCSREMYFNPSSVYAAGVAVRAELDTARATIMNCLDAPRDGKVYFTGSATEANNTILRGLAKKNKKILVGAGEHPSVYETAKSLKNDGYEVEFVKLQTNGLLDIEHLNSLLDDTVGLVSFIHVSNETGAINDIAEISKLIKSKSPKCIVHCDGVQAFLKIPFSLSETLVDAYTISSHKIHGPKGVGAFYIRNGININPIMLGGGQEGGVRSGTENAPAILAFVLACKIMASKLQQNYAHALELKNLLIKNLSEKCTDFSINSLSAPTSPNILSVAFAGVKGEVLLHALESHGVLVSTGSACSSKLSGNRVLQAMGQSPSVIEGNIRFSFSEFNTADEIIMTVNYLAEELTKLRKLKR